MRNKIPRLLLKVPSDFHLTPKLRAIFVGLLFINLFRVKTHTLPYVFRYLNNKISSDGFYSMYIRQVVPQLLLYMKL